MNKTIKIWLIVASMMDVLFIGALSVYFFAKATCTKVRIYSEWGGYTLDCKSSVLGGVYERIEGLGYVFGFGGWVVALVIYFFGAKKLRNIRKEIVSTGDAHNIRFINLAALLYSIPFVILFIIFFFDLA